MPDAFPPVPAFVTPVFTAKSFRPGPDVLGKPTCPVTQTAAALTFTTGRLPRRRVGVTSLVTRYRLCDMRIGPADTLIQTRLFSFPFSPPVRWPGRSLGFPGRTSSPRSRPLLSGCFPAWFPSRRCNSNHRWRSGRRWPGHAFHTCVSRPQPKPQGRLRSANLAETLRLVRAWAVYQQRMEEDGVALLHLQVRPGAPRVVVPHSVIHLVHASLEVDRG